MISKRNTPPFNWGDACDGWRLLDAADLQVIQERMPPATSEVMHLHARATQLYFVLEGEAVVDVDGHAEVLRRGEAVVIERSTPHRISNRSETPLEFLVVSSSPTRLDRENLE